MFVGSTAKMKRFVRGTVRVCTIVQGRMCAEKTVPGGRVGILCSVYKSKVVIIRIVVGRMNSEP